MLDTRPTKLASAIVPGDLVAERDGAYFQVTAVRPAPRKRVTFTLANVNKYRSASTEFEHTVRATAQVYVVIAEQD
jgi:hypothetical protein